MLAQPTKNSCIYTAGIWGGRNTPQYLASDPADVSSAKERAKKGARGIFPPILMDFKEITLI